MVNRVHVWVVSNGGPPKLSLPRASKMLRPGLIYCMQNWRKFARINTCGSLGLGEWGTGTFWDCVYRVRFQKVLVGNTA